MSNRTLRLMTPTTFPSSPMTGRPETLFNFGIVSSNVSVGFTVRTPSLVVRMMPITLPWGHCSERRQDDIAWH